jgi:hypothetical protein
MNHQGGAGERHSLRGPIDRPALIAIRDLCAEIEPLVTATLDDFLNPSRCTVSFDDGLRDADSTRLDVRWTRLGDYSFHYTERGGIDCRWDRHPHGGDYVACTGLAHSHPPPDASSDPQAVEESCITHASPHLVTRAVLKCWREAYHAESVEPLNAISNPP